jgi:hypothetical protein
MRLERDWPSTLLGWDQRETAARDDCGRYCARGFFSHPILVIDLAHELGLDSILTAALYDLSRYGPSKIMVGTLLPVDPHLPDPEAEDPVVVRLSHSWLCRAFKGREYAQQFITTFIENELKVRDISPRCANRYDQAGRLCRESFHFLKLNIIRAVGGMSSGRDGDPLFTLLQAIEMLTRTDFSNGVTRGGLNMCHACKLDFAVTVGKAREEVWARIPGWFGLCRDQVEMHM